MKYLFGCTASAKWQRQLLGAGGFVTGLDIADDGKRLCRSDGGGAYLWDESASEWQQIITQKNFPASLTGNVSGIWEAKFAPSNSDIIYISYVGYIFKSTNGGTDWQQTGFPRDSTYTASTSANSSWRTCNNKIGVDPNNPDIIYVWYGNTGGLYVSFNGGQTASLVSDVPASASGNSPGGAGIAFDRIAGTTTVNGQTRTANIYVPSWGNGVYQSTDGGQNFASIQPSNTPNAVNYTTTTTDTLIFVLVETFSTAEVAVSDDHSLTWIKRAGPVVNAANGTRLYEYYAVAASAATYAITVSYTGVSTANRIGVFAIEGADTASPFDPNLAAGAATSTTGAPTISTANANDFIINFTTNFATGADTNYTVLASGAPTTSFFSQYRIVSATQSSIAPDGAGSVATSGITDAVVQAAGETLALHGTPVLDQKTYSAGPVHICDGDCARWTIGNGITDHRYYVACSASIPGSENHAWRYNDDSTWQDLANPTNAGTVAIDHQTPGTVLWFQAGSGIASYKKTTDGGSTVVGHNDTETVLSGDIPWQINTNINGTSGCCRFDPTQSNVVYCATGFGIKYFTPSGTSFNSTVQSLGIEGITIKLGRSVPNGPTMIGCQDVGMMMPESTYNTTPSFWTFDSNNTGSGLQAAWGLDYASSDNTFLVVVTSEESGSKRVGVSSSSGADGSWSSISPNPISSGTPYVEVACASPTNMVLTCNTNGTWTGAGLSTGVPIYTTNATTTLNGTTWASCQLDTGGDLPSSGWQSGVSNPKIICAADRSAIGTFYMRNATQSAIGGLYKSTDGGATWTLLTTSGLSFQRSNPNDGASSKLRASPYDYSQQSWSSDLWYCTDGLAASGPTDSLWHCTDGGSTWAKIYNGITGCLDFDFGIPKTADGPPTVFILATVDSVPGVFVCEDYVNAPSTWTLLEETNSSFPNNRPAGLVSYPVCVAGDGRYYKRCYIGYNVGLAVYRG